METRQKNLIFQFLEEMYEEEKDTNSLFLQEKKLIEKLEALKTKYPGLKDAIFEIIDIAIILNSEVKRKYFEYGLMAKEVMGTTNLEWNG